MRQQQIYNMDGISQTGNGVVTCRKLLKQRSRDVCESEIDEVKQLLKESLGRQPNCAGLAAIQIGIKVRAAIYKFDGQVGYLINPQITQKSGHQISDEGCMSFPGVRRKVERRMAVSVESEGKTRQFVAFNAAVIQHEVDHMNGITVNESRIRKVSKSPDKDKAKRKAAKKQKRKNR